MKLFFAAALAVLFACPAFAAVEYDEATHSLTISGQTTTYQAIQAHAVFLKHDVDTVYMSGPGGEFYAGLSLGRQIAKEGARVIIPRDARCISACAFAAIAAGEIHVDGALWLHRPFTIGVPAMETIESIAADYGAAYLDLAEYMLELGFDVAVTRQIVENSSPCRFIVVNAADEVAHARREGFFGAYATENKCGA